MKLTIENIEKLGSERFLSEIDILFASFIMKISGSTDSILYFSAALASFAVGQGHICADLDKYAGKNFPGSQADESSGEEKSGTIFSIDLPNIKEWLESFRSGEAKKVVGNPGERKPLMLDLKNRLYLYRYWNYEHKLAEFIRQKTESDCGRVELTPEIRNRFNTYFPKSDSVPDWQRVAAFASLRKKLLILSGGPGTGKTYTAARILALLLEQNKNLKTAVAAPTGKAAVNIQQTIQHSKNAAVDSLEFMNCPEEIKKILPDEAKTIHRLLGTVGDSPYFRHNSENPLDIDLLLVDEASMVPLPLMSKLMQALKPETKVILIGDKDQLSSVEPGSVFGDICNASKIFSFSENFKNEYMDFANEKISVDGPKATHLSDCSVQLQISRRFPQGESIDKISRAVNSAETEEDADNIIKLIESCSDKIKYLPLKTKSPLGKSGFPLKELRETVINGFRDFMNSPDIETALQNLDRFRIFCALREGPFGVKSLNSIVEKFLSFESDGRERENENREISSPLIPDEKNEYYIRRPVMITENDYNLNLFNGDTGVIWQNSEDKSPRAYFRFPDGGLKNFSVSILPKHETAFAITVHKSQGSGFDNILFVLPFFDNPVLTKELIYTAITRTKNMIYLWMNRDVFRKAVVRKTRRSSGLKDALE